MNVNVIGLLMTRAGIGTRSTECDLISRGATAIYTTLTGIPGIFTLSQPMHPWLCLGCRGFFTVSGRKRMYTSRLIVRSFLTCNSNKIAYSARVRVSETRNVSWNRAWQLRQHVFWKERRSRVSSNTKLLHYSGITRAMAKLLLTISI